MTLALVGCAAMTALAADPATRPAGRSMPDWLALAPADAELYVEFRDLAGIRAQLQNVGVWAAINQLSSQVRGNDAPRANSVSESLLGMTTEEAVTQVLGQRTALIARSPAQWRQGLVLARLPNFKTLPDLLKRWNAKSDGVTGPVVRYRLGGPDGLRLACRGGLLLLGPAEDPEAMWDQTVLLMAGKRIPNLADNAQLRNLLGRFTGPFSGLIVHCPHAASSAPADEADSSAFAAAIRFSEKSLNVEMVQHGRPFGSTQPSSHMLLRALPDETIACWSGRLDLGSTIRGAQAEPHDSLVRLALGMLRLAPGAQGLLDLDAPREMALVLLRDPADLEYEAPAVALVMATDNPGGSVAEFDAVANMITGLVNTQLARSGAGGEPLRAESGGEAGRKWKRVRFGRALAAYNTCPYLNRLELVWGGMGDRLVIATSVESWKRLADSAPQAGRHEFEPPEGRTGLQWFFVRGTKLARMMRTWRDYAVKHAPYALQSQWWAQRARKRARESARLGVTVRSESQAAPAAVILDVDSGSPADGVLRSGDVIVAAEGRPIASTRPAREIADAFRNRAADAEFHVEIMREGKRRSIKVNLPSVTFEAQTPVAPLLAIHPFIAVGQCISACSFSVDDSTDGVTSAHLTIEWHLRPATQPAPK